MIFLRENDGAVLLSLHVQPKASRTAIVGIHGDSLKIAVQAPPVGLEQAKSLLEEHL